MFTNIEVVPSAESTAKRANERGAALATALMLLVQPTMFPSADWVNFAGVLIAIAALLREILLAGGLKFVGSDRAKTGF